MYAKDWDGRTEGQKLEDEIEFGHGLVWVMKLVDFTVCKNPLLTGCSDWKSSKVNGCSSETVDFSPYFGEAKMRLGGNFFLKNCY